MLPDMNGFEILKEIRAQSINCAIIMLTAKGLESDKVLGLQLGADDYVQKPFPIAELLARIGANLRRQFKVEHIFNFADIDVDLKQHLVTQN